MKEYMSANSHVFIQIFEVISTVLIAGMVGLIHYKQYQLEKRSIQFNLYEKRLKIYRVIEKVFSLVHADAQFQIDEEFFLAKAEANFLFGKDVQDLFKKLRRTAYGKNV